MINLNWLISFLTFNLRTRHLFISTELHDVQIYSSRLINGSTKDNDGDTREMDIKKKTGWERLDPASTYLSVLSGRPWPPTQSRPLMSPTNYPDVLQAGSGFFVCPWYMPFPLCLSPWQGLTSNSMPKSASLKLLCFLANTDMLMNQRSFFLPSKPLWYNKHITCLNKMSFFPS